MKFEYDPKKSTLNKDKHGTDFDKAQELWDDPDGIEAAACPDFRVNVCG